MVPGIKEACALSKMLKEHPIFSMFHIINVAGDGDEEKRTDTALQKVRDAIKQAGEDGYTITLSYGKLTTGVTIKEWTTVLMLSGTFSTSASSYLQTIFHVQSPCNQYGKIKDNCYVFDFAPDRTLKMMTESVALSTKAGKTKESDKKIMSEFLNYCPVISIDGTIMKEYNTNRLLQQLKHAYAECAVQNGFDDTNLYNDELLKLTDVNLADFEKLKGIIGKSKAQQKTEKIDMNNQGFTEEEYAEKEKLEKKPAKQRTPEEQARLDELNEKKKNRTSAISILRGISIHMPLLIYGADIPIDEDFTIDMLLDDKIVDEASWNEFMPSGVTREVFKQFMKYYDQDIFVAAGRRIRNTVIGADELAPTERVKQIALLFACFKNPDKETVLTPWRVVNMHMSNCLGGYSFYAENPSVNAFMLEKPRFVNRGKVTADTFCNQNAHILEINSKTGLYSLYVVYSIFRARCAEFTEEELTIEKQNELWAETVRENIFVVCKTPMAKFITKRTLVGFRKISVNAHYFDDLINTMQPKQKQFVDKVLKPSYWNRKGKKMKFDAVVGNPPYQEEGNGNTNAKKSIYHYFIDMSEKISRMGTLIHPARFLFNAGDTPKEWNESKLNDIHYKVIKYWSNSLDIFPTVDIKGGIVVTYWNKDEIYKPIKFFTPHRELQSILYKVELLMHQSLSEVITNRGTYKYSNLAYAEQTEEMKKTADKRIAPSAFERMPLLFTENKPNDGNKYIQMLGNIKNKRCYRWLRKDYIAPVDNLEKYKVIVPKANGSGAIGEVLSTPLIGYTETYISIGVTDNKSEAEATLKYIKTKFARIMLGFLKVTQNNPRETWKYVPMQDFTSQSDIDWNKSIADIDKQLYTKYGFTDEEIEFVESMIKPME